MKKLLLLALYLVALQSCTDKNFTGNKPEASMGSGDQTEISVSAVDSLLQKIESAHYKSKFLEAAMVQFDIHLEFNGRPRLNGTITLTTDSKYVRIDKSDGSSLIYNGNQVFLSPGDASDKGARFDMFTWSYFFALPYKLQDDGTKLELLQNGNDQQIIRLSFEEGTGDAPDDWYDIFLNDRQLVEYAGYIVTFGGTDAKDAEANAHAIGYSNYKEVDGIPIAHTWSFYNYSAQEVELEKVIGRATIKDVQFKNLDTSIFRETENAKEIKL